MGAMMLIGTADVKRVRLRRHANQDELRQTVERLQRELAQVQAQLGASPRIHPRQDRRPHDTRGSPRTPQERSRRRSSMRARYRSPSAASPSSRAIYRNHNEVADVSSNFNTGIPYPNQSQYHLSEFRATARQSRLFAASRRARKTAMPAPRRISRWIFRARRQRRTPPRAIPITRACASTTRPTVARTTTCTCSRASPSAWRRMFNHGLNPRHGAHPLCRGRPVRPRLQLDPQPAAAISEECRRHARVRPVTGKPAGSDLLGPEPTAGPHRHDSARRNAVRADGELLARHHARCHREGGVGPGTMATTSYTGSVDRSAIAPATATTRSSAAVSAPA